MVKRIGGQFHVAEGGQFHIDIYNYNFDLTSIVTLHDPNLLFFDTLY